MGDFDQANQAAPRPDTQKPKARPQQGAPKPTADSGPTCDINGVGDSCAMARLEVSPTSIDFGSVEVGKSKLVTVVLTNEATTEVEVEAMSVRQEGLGDFAVGGSNPILAPKERANVGVYYRPSAAGKHVGTLQLFATHVAADQISLAGQGLERPDQRDKRVVEQDQISEAASASGTKSHHSDRVRIEASIDKWAERADEFARKSAVWAANNWTNFYAETGGDFNVAWSEGHLNNVLGDALSFTAGLVSSHPVVEFLASTLASLLWDAAFTHKGNKDNEKTVHDKVKQTGRQSATKHLKFEFQADAVVAQVRALASTARHRAWSATTVDELEQIRTWLGHQHVPKPPSPTNDSLKLLLLKDWVLERAADANSAGHNTNSASYEEARKTAHNLEGDAKLARRDLFIYQARHEWSTLALGNVAQAEADLRSRVATYERQGRAGGVKDLAQFVVNMIDAQLSFTIPQPELTAHVLQNGQMPNIPLRAEGLRSSRSLGCHLKLATDGESVIVSKYHYYHVGGYAGTRTPG